MTRHKVAACIITGDAFKEEEVEKLLDSLEPHVHGIFVAFNGQKDMEVGRWQVSDRETPIYIRKFKWEEDFAKARQQSFDMVPKDEFDWMMWIDTDDEFRVAEESSLQQMLDSLDPYTQGVFLKYNYAIEPNTGMVVVEQWRERILSTKVPWEWRFPIHEVCAAPAGTQFARKNEVWIDHLRKSGEDRGARERNRKIIARAIKEFPDEPRFMFYFAGETMAEADAANPGEEKNRLADAAIIAYENYKAMVPSLTDDVFIASTRIAELHRMKGDHARAIDADLISIAIFPDWPDGYIGAAKSCMELEDYRRQKAFASIATKLLKPITVASIEPMNSGFYPYFLKGIAEENLGEFDQAVVDYKKAREFWNPPNGLLEEKIAKLSSHERDSSKEEASDSDRKKLRGTKPEKSICFYTSSLPFVWHPNEDAGAGSERAVMQLSSMFAADGWRVVVFGTPGVHRGVHEGVEYWDSNEFLPAEPFHTFVSSRAPAPFEVDVNSKRKILWMHDVNAGPALIPVKDRPDVVLGLTNWHKNHLQRLYGVDPKKLLVMPNGINVDRFKKDRSDSASRNPNFIWSSSPDRGLETLLGLWPVIRERYPEARLDIYYGWNMIDRIIQMSRQAGQMHWLENFRAQIINQMNILGYEDGGIFNHGRVGQDELAEALYESDFWPYTTQFLETFCITALETQAAGVIPITSDLGALKETVLVPENKIEGWPLNLTYQNQWINRLFYLMESASDDEIREMREKSREFALNFTWEAAYSKWNNLIMNM